MAGLSVTLEDVIRPIGIKVPGQTCIQPGIYAVQLTMSQRFSRVLPLLLNVPMFEGIRIHPGNTSADTGAAFWWGGVRGQIRSRKAVTRSPACSRSCAALKRVESPSPSK